MSCFLRMVVAEPMIAALGRSLDFSFNSIRHISNIQSLGQLRMLYFVQNKISRVRPNDFAGSIAIHLRSLELGGNRLRVSSASLETAALLASS